MIENKEKGNLKIKLSLFVFKKIYCEYNFSLNQFLNFRGIKQ